MSRVAAAVLAGAALLVGGCGGGEAAEPAGEAPEQAEAQEPEQEEQEEPSRCLPVPPAVVKAIATGLTVQGGGSLRKAAAVKSEDFKSVYFISADIQGPGLEGSGDVGTWATNRLRVGGLIYSVDSVASEFSDWGEGDSTDAQLSMGDDGAEESKECAEQAR